MNEVGNQAKSRRGYDKYDRAFYKRAPEVDQFYFHFDQTYKECALRALFERRTLQHDKWADAACHPNYRGMTAFRRTDAYVEQYIISFNFWRKKYGKPPMHTPFGSPWWQSEYAERIWKQRQILDVLGLDYNAVGTISSIFSYYKHNAKYKNMPLHTQILSSNTAKRVAYHLLEKQGRLYLNNYERVNEGVFRRVQEIASTSVKFKKGNSLAEYEPKESDISEHMVDNFTTDGLDSPTPELDAETTRLFGSAWPRTDSRLADGRARSEASKQKRVEKGLTPYKPGKGKKRKRPDDKSAARTARYRERHKDDPDFIKRQREQKAASEKRRRQRIKIRNNMPTDTAAFMDAFNAAFDGSCPIEREEYEKAYTERRDEIEALIALWESGEVESGADDGAVAEPIHQEPIHVAPVDDDEERTMDEWFVLLDEANTESGDDERMDDADLPF